MAKKRKAEKFGVKPDKRRERDLSSLQALLEKEDFQFAGTARGQISMQDRMHCLTVAREWCPPNMSLKQAITVTFGVYWKMWGERQ